MQSAHTYMLLCLRLFIEGREGKKITRVKGAVSWGALESRVWVLVSKLSSNLWLYPLKATKPWASQILLLNLDVRPGSSKWR